MAVNVERDPLSFIVQDDPLDGPRHLPAVADPAPLGLAALALTTLVFSVFNAGLMGEIIKIGPRAAAGGPA